MKTKYRKNKNKNKSRKIVKGGFCKSFTNLFKRKQSVKVDPSDKVIKQINEHVKTHQSITSIKDLNTWEQQLNDIVVSAMSMDNNTSTIDNCVKQEITNGKSMNAALLHCIKLLKTTYDELRTSTINNPTVKKHEALVKRNATATHLNSKDKFDPETYLIKQKKLNSHTTMNVKWLETNKDKIKESKKLYTKLMKLLDEPRTIKNAEKYGIPSKKKLDEWYDYILINIPFYIKSLCLNTYKSTDEIDGCIAQTTLQIIPSINEYYNDMTEEFNKKA